MDTSNFEITYQSISIYNIKKVTHILQSYSLAMLCERMKKDTNHIIDIQRFAGRCLECHQQCGHHYHVRSK